MPPNGKHGDLFLSSGGMLCSGAPNILMNDPNNEHERTQCQIWSSPFLKSV